MSLPRSGSKTSIRTLDSIRREPRSSASPGLGYSPNDEAILPDDSSHRQPSISSPDVTHQIPPFKPFFTIVENSSGSGVSQHHVPSVHYIFSDDDNHILSEAALRALDDGIDLQERAGEAEIGDAAFHEQQQYRAHAEDEQEDHLLPPPQPGVREHYVVLDVDVRTNSNSYAIDPAFSSNPYLHQGTPPYSASTSSLRARASSTATARPLLQPPAPPSHSYTYTITSSTSLSPTWQVLSSNLLPAPTMDQASMPGAIETGISASPDDRFLGQGITVTPNPESTEQHGLMLRVDGIDANAFSADHNNLLRGPGKGKKARNISGGEGARPEPAVTSDLDALTTLFESRMRDLERVAGAARESEEKAKERDREQQELEAQDEKIEEEEEVQEATEHDTHDTHISGAVADETS